MPMPTTVLALAVAMGLVATIAAVCTGPPVDGMTDLPNAPLPVCDDAWISFLFGLGDLSEPGPPLAPDDVTSVGEGQTMTMTTMMTTTTTTDSLGPVVDAPIADSDQRPSPTTASYGSRPRLPPSELYVSTAREICDWIPSFNDNAHDYHPQFDLVMDDPVLRAGIPAQARLPFLQKVIYMANLFLKEFPDGSVGLRSRDPGYYRRWSRLTSMGGLMSCFWTHCNRSVADFRRQYPRFSWRKFHLFCLGGPVCDHERKAAARRQANLVSSSRRRKKAMVEMSRRFGAATASCDVLPILESGNQTNIAEM